MSSALTGTALLHMFIALFSCALVCGRHSNIQATCVMRTRLSHPPDTHVLMAALHIYMGSIGLHARILHVNKMVFQHRHRANQEGSYAQCRAGGCVWGPAAECGAALPARQRHRRGCGQCSWHTEGHRVRAPAADLGFCISLWGYE